MSMLPLMFGSDLVLVEVFACVCFGSRELAEASPSYLPNLWSRGMLMLRLCCTKAAREHGTQIIPALSGDGLLEDPEA